MLNTDSILNRPPRFDDIQQSLLYAPKMPRGMVRETKELVAIARRFNEEVVKPMSGELDLKIQQDPDYLPWEFVEKANDWGFYSFFIPRAVGGHGYCMPGFSSFLEEIASSCVAMANLIGVHYLGVCSLALSWNAPIMKKVLGEVIEGEKTHKPCLLSLAITEPGAGTDVEEMELIDKGKITARAKKTDGGYILNGRKVFISCGHLASWHIVIAYRDDCKPSEGMVNLAIPTDTKGFSLGRMERKCGQKACCASELIFEDVFVPDHLVAMDPPQVKKLNRPVSSSQMQMMDYAFCVTRPAVGAFGTGVARGAFEEALDFAKNTRVEGERLIDCEWVQSYLAQMFTNIQLGRLAYTEANYSSSLFGLYKLLQFKPFYYYLKYAPEKLLEKVVPPLMDKKWMTFLMRKIFMDGQVEYDSQTTAGWSSLAKASGTDIGMKNCQMALDLMGQAGIRHDRRAEKIMRDAKLLQIYEGSNQLNRLNVFKCLIGRDIDDVKEFHA